jgi:hypothetical protein
MLSQKLDVLDLSQNAKNIHKTIFDLKTSNDILSRAKSAKFGNFNNFKNKKTPSLQYKNIICSFCQNENN